MECMPFIDLFSRKKNTCDLLVNVDGKIVEKYRYFREFLTWNRLALNTIAELEQAYYAGEPLPLGAIRKKYDNILASTRQLIAALDGMTKGKYAGLSDACDRIHRDILPLFESRISATMGDMVLPMASLQPEMVSLAGSKATNLAVIGNVLGLTIPPGFVITAQAFYRFLEESGLSAFVQEKLADITPEMTPEMEEICRIIQSRVLEAEIPTSLSEAILDQYARLEAATQKNVPIAMRSSAVGEDTEASFAGQYITELNVDRDSVLHAYRLVIASKYSPRAILYRLRYGLEDWETPMCVAAIAMVDAGASGVIYTIDPSHPESSVLKINAIWGLGEHLVSGEASPDAFFVNRNTRKIIRRDIAEKSQKLISLAEGGTILESVREDEKNLPSIDDATVLKLADYGQRLETYFAAPQDVEWAVDSRGEIFILQSRPLGLIPETTSSIAPPVFPDYPVLLSRGKTASRGTAIGRVFLAERYHQEPMPPDAILVARFASPDHAVLMGKVRGIITDVGSVASHLASVAREFHVPAIFDTGSATTILKDGEAVTLVADTTTVYQGMIPEVGMDSVQSFNRHIIESPIHRRMKAVLDHISPLNLTDPKHPSFAPEGCATIHDIIRFAHENAVNEMFGLAGDDKRDVTTIKLTANFPLSLYCIDLGGGLRNGLTTCETVTPFDFESIPMKAIWSGFAHPGISWSGTVNFGFGNLMTLMASSATAEVGAGMPGGDSFAVLSGEYLNLSARFGYHYANVDTFCGEDPDQNYIALQFSGGAGAYLGRSMRIRFLSGVLARLGFSVTETGDRLEAGLSGSDRTSMETILDQLGRLLAASRLLDMAIPNQDRITALTEGFFKGDYDFLGNAGINSLPNFYTHAGAWKTVEADGKALWLQDGSQWGNALSAGVANLMGRMVGSKYQEFLDNIRAYYYFPIAIARESAVSDAVLHVDVQPVSGSIDQAGGLVFGLMNVGNYFVLRINALEDNFTLFEFVNDRRFQRATVHRKIATGHWYRIQAEISGNTLKGYLDDELLIEYTAARNLKGYAGLWTKADSVTQFGALTIESNGIGKVVNAQIGGSS